MELKTGDKLGPYEIVSRLGVGGMGEVWRARDSRLNRDVAIKVSCSRSRARKEHHPSRSQNGQRQDSARRFGEGARLRTGESERTRDSRITRLPHHAAHSDTDRSDSGDSGLHGAGTGAGKDRR